MGSRGKYKIQAEAHNLEGNSLEPISKAIDTAIKAPLWFWFAVMIASGIPMFNIPNLVDIGIGADYKVQGFPLALIALLSTALFAASACARSWGALGRVAAPLVDRFSVWWSLSRLDREARAILCVLEEDGAREIYYPPGDPHLSRLRDHGLLLPNLVGANRDWGLYNLADKFERATRRYRGMVRRKLRVEQDLSDRVRAQIVRARRASSRRV